MYPFIEDETTPPLSPSIEGSETMQSLSPSMEEASPPLSPSLEDLSLSMFPSIEEMKSPSNLPIEEETPPPPSSKEETTNHQPTAPPLLPTSPPFSPSMEETAPPQQTAPPFLPPPPPLIASGLVMGLPTLPVTQRVNVARLQPRVPWSTGLFDCHKDVDNCCMTCFCPCITFGQIAEIVDHGSSSCCGNGLLYSAIMCLTGFHSLYSCFYRSKMRGQFFLQKSPCADCCIHCFCEPCALCQEYRELRHRGLDPQFGWHGNVARQVAMVPPSNIDGMTR